MSGRRGRTVRVHALAKINLTLRVFGRHVDGYHDIRTVFQSIALRDTLVFEPVDGPFSLQCSSASCPADRGNLVWKAAEHLWRWARRRGTPHGVRAVLRKSIPLQSGLGGGSSDAAASLRALADFWGLDVAPDVLAGLGADLGADVPFFLHGGTALGVDRGDTIFRLPDFPSHRVVLAIPGVGVSTADAYRWLDERAGVRPRSVRRARLWLERWDVPAGELGNDLEAPVVARHPHIGRLVRGFERAGATYAAMSGSGSAVFGLFDDRHTARSAAQTLARPGIRTLVTRTVTAGQARTASEPREP